MNELFGPWDYVGFTGMLIMIISGIGLAVAALIRFIQFLIFTTDPLLQPFSFFALGLVLFLTGAFLGE